MLINYLKIVCRNIKKHKGYSLINILGLAVGIAVCSLIYLYVSHEMSYDKYHTKSDRIYRVTIDHPRAHIAMTPSMILPTSKRLFPEVETGVRLFDVGSFNPLVVRHENRVFEERSIVYTDSTLFDVFDFEMIAGNENNALKSPQSAVLTQNMSELYFGNDNAVGQTLEIGGSDYEVTGVIQNIPGNGLTFIIAFATVSWQAVQSAKLDPAESI